MSFLDKITQAFTMGFGITQPTRAQQRRAGIFIISLLLTILAVFVGLGFFLMHNFLG